MVGSVSVPSPEDPDAAFAAVIALRRVAAGLEAEAVAEALASGWTWAEVGQALGVSAQAVHKKHAARLGQRPTGQRPARSGEKP